ncbi:MULTISPECIES: adenylate/guanylate cyclase domain-containing protein [unclassified Carboxylicivirga]|uniref:adenylate/guanylate cyclase domain-containing protein n=1 Tax=Carboxylicivirga TaxID=1628153 RepID=UPI003D33F11B
MFLFDKLKIQTRNLIASLTYHLAFWLAALAFYIFITGDHSLFINYFGLLIKDDIYGNTVLLSGLLALLFTIPDLVSSDTVMRYSPIRFLVFFRFVLYLLLALLIIFFSANKTITLKALSKIDVLYAQMPALTLQHFRFIAWFYLACILNNTFRGIFRKIGVGNFTHWLTGTLNKPRVEKRIFMFIDMKSSVTIAEKLGHKKFSYLVQDVFRDMAIVENYHGAIYQYLGDGAIISWDLKRGIRNNNCLKAFFAFQKVIHRRRLLYDMQYGLVPEFKAGLHVGEIMVLQVGQFKRDISYNGDTLNTTARIESMCNQYKQNLLISGVLYESLRRPEEFKIDELDTIKLKGKSKGIQIYKVALKEKKKKRRKRK